MMSIKTPFWRSESTTLQQRAEVDHLLKHLRGLVLSLSRKKHTKEQRLVITAELDITVCMLAQRLTVHELMALWSGSALELPLNTGGNSS